MGKTTKKLSKADREAQQRLRAIWERSKDELKLTQASVAADLGKSQGLIAQYLNGHTALGPVATLMFARVLRCQPKDIRPDFKYGTIVPSELPPDVVEIAIKLASIPEAARRDVIGYLNVTLSQSYIDWVVKTDNANGKRKPVKEPEPETNH